MDTSLERVRSAGRARRATGGPEGNERLTAVSAAVLFVLLAAEGVTIVFLRPLLSAHVFIGMLLIPPVALKTASTGWRFVRYYAGDRSYREKGPPLLPLRLLAPLVVASTAALFATGVALLVVGPSRGVVLGLHKASFAVWFVAMSVHVLAYIRRVPGLARSDWRRADPAPIGGSFARRTLLAAALVAGVVLALVTVRYAQPWVHWAAAFHGHDG